jgi:glycosyltransferase involved in cell wall biosynthesis
MKYQLVSVIVPCYNQSQYLPETLKSVFDQTYPLWECIIVNDGSPDHTEQVAMDWCKKDSRFIYLKKENGGLSSARNAGLEIAKGEYIQFLDSDDLINKFKFEKQIKCFDKNTDVVISDYFPFDNETGAFFRSRYMNPFPTQLNYKYEILIDWEFKLSIPCHCVLFKSSLLIDNEILRFDETLPNHEDWFFWVRLFNYSKGLYTIKDALASYRIHNEGMCEDTAIMNQGFVMACKSIISFFEVQNDKKGIQLSKQKLLILENKLGSIGKENYFKTYVMLFIPPVLLMIKNKFFKR